MADIQAFRGIRYDLGKVGALSDVVAPPYDVIDTEFQTTLYDRNEHNVVRNSHGAGSCAEFDSNRLAKARSIHMKKPIPRPRKIASN